MSDPGGGKCVASLSWRVLCKWPPAPVKQPSPVRGSFAFMGSYNPSPVAAAGSCTRAPWNCGLAFCKIIYDAPCNMSRTRYEFADEEREVAAMPFDLHIILNSPSPEPLSASPPAVTLQLFPIFPPIKRPKRKFPRPPREVECKYTFYNVLSHSVALRNRTSLIRGSFPF